ncbi:Gfo/Idh/MocA family protein [Lysinibacillus sp. JNUCC 51]|uniref:Gfo/Idh/MocA family protein n=1 Tax=Lysinibacillus sp. JNUCC-51 TaxID=2792479 RepID=UPI001937AEBE|nr:Gfo/Idh/MocA family oxidoreductase [Lysinibacillus sp. JNUCC-51]
MENRIIHVGIIGGSLNNQWASQTHIPALKNNPYYKITAIGTSNIDTAKESAKILNAPHSFTEYKELAQTKDVDLVVVSIKVPHHYDAVMAVLEENKHIYCEWPLAINTKQAEKLAQLADERNIHHAIGLQGRQSPEVNYLKQAIWQGDIGNIISCTMQVATQGKGAVTDEKSRYLLHEDNGATLLSINGGHSLDVLCYILGDFKELSATMNVHYSEAFVQETGKKTVKNTADQILIQGTLINGTSASVHIQGGVYPAFQLEIRGEKGAYRLTQKNSYGHVQFGNLIIEKMIHPNNLFNSKDVLYEEIKIPSELNNGPISYVDQAYTMLAKDIVGCTKQIPDFNDAVKLHQLLDAVRKSAKTGKRILI